MKHLSLFALLLIPSLASAQSVSLPAQVKGDAQAWVHVKPVKVDGGPVKWRIDPELEEILPETFLPPEAAKLFVGKLVKGGPGKYRVEAWNAKGNLASDIATCWVVIGKGEPQPPTLRAKSLTFVVLGVTQHTVRITEDAGFRAWLKMNGVGVYGISTKAQQDANPKFAGISSPAIVLQDQNNEVLDQRPLSENMTIDDAKSFVSRYLR